ncbi:cation:proton antiporter [Aliiglaciecola sp. CAU 1673]|uniref:cation:proton antiporter domain-containing protein n=1 Tax=Aliiglaciecola sp. CAU 1673 TaxID=3032595 RepID=UPI0023DADC57|nr:cation:proton antiporter [Aliiglaciecola sp. CAU 1673]MDF2180169.1 cation:proton antiporter [Aliiglaciecola sp. CAU 1673]
MEFIWVLFAFICGLGVKILKLPPLIGFLAAGFFLNYVGIKPAESLDALADLGITLLLFTIGLKLNIKDLLKREVWLGTGAHMLAWTAFICFLVIALGSLSLAYFAALDWQVAAMLGFALSFSSTVCIVKLLEEAGEMKTRHGKVAIGVLVMQDILAVLFLVMATGKVPSIFALGLFGLLLIKPLIKHLVQQSGHGELLPLTGFFLALGGYELFELVGIKGDLGALVMGLLLSNHAKAAELNKALLSFKDLFLIGFFLSIGFTALPTLEMIGLALLLCLLLPIKFLMFFFVFTGLRLRGRTAYLAGLALSNFSEFGLIVVALCVDNSWLPKEWLVILALAVSFSFVFTSVLYRYAHQGYSKYQRKIKHFESRQRLPEDVYLQPLEARVLVVGLGRVGKGAFLALADVLGEKVWGMDADRDRIERQKKQGMQVMLGDAEDADLWDNMDLSAMELILLALPSVEDIRHIHDQLRNAGYKGQLAAIARYEDERQELLEHGIDHVFNFYTEAGTGFAEESLLLING